MISRASSFERVISACVRQSESLLVGESIMPYLAPAAGASAAFVLHQQVRCADLALVSIDCACIMSKLWATVVCCHIVLELVDVRSLRRLPS